MLVTVTMTNSTSLSVASRCEARVPRGSRYKGITELIPGHDIRWAWNVGLLPGICIQKRIQHANGLEMLEIGVDKEEISGIRRGMH